MQLTLAEVVKDKKTSKKLFLLDFTDTNPTSTSEDESSRTLCFIIDSINGGDSGAVMHFPNGSIPRRLGLENILPKEIGGISYDELAHLLRSHMDEKPSLTFDYELAADDKRYSGLTKVPAEDRRRVQDTLRTLFRYYRAREYLKAKLEENGLTYGTIETVKGSESWHDGPKPALLLKGKTLRESRIHVAYLDNGTLVVADKKYLALFRVIATTLAKDYNINPFEVKTTEQLIGAR